MERRHLYTVLALAGASPFVLIAALLFAGIVQLEPFGDLNVVLGSYGLAIVSFLAGTHWATSLYLGQRSPYNLFILSNIVFLVVWFSFVLAGTAWVLASQLLALSALLLIDYRIYRCELISADYFRARAIATTVAIVPLLIILVT